MAYPKEETKEYGKVNFDFLLMTHIQDINKQLAKLPHESVMPDYNEPVGTTYKDIITSYCNMVEHLGYLLKPYWDDEFKGAKISEAKTFQTASVKFGHLMELCDRRGFLFTKMKVRASGENEDVAVGSALEA